METVRVSCPYHDRLEVPPHKVIYELHQDGEVATYQFECPKCDKMRWAQATIADIDTFKIYGVRTPKHPWMRERFNQLIEETKIATFALELECTDDIVGRLS